MAARLLSRARALATASEILHRGTASRSALAVALSAAVRGFHGSYTACAAKKGKSAAEIPAAAEDAGAPSEEGASSGKDVKTMMAAHINYARQELGKLRGATANPAMLDSVQVEAYGDVQPISALAQVVMKNAQLLVVNPFDAALAPAIADAIRGADLNLNPSVDGNVVKVPVPKSSKETREATVKLISKIAESAKTRIRRVRQNAIDKLKKIEGISPDDVFREIKDIQAHTNAATDEVSKLAEKKKLEVEQA